MSDARIWLDRLKEGFATHYPLHKHGLRLPSGIAFEGQGDEVRIVLSKEGVEEANMQADAAAFEAWALVLHGYAKAKRVQLAWRGANPSRPHHAWRFRFRAHHFARLFSPWFCLEGTIPPAFEPAVSYLLNVENKPRQGPAPAFSKDLKERQLEDAIARHPVISRRFSQEFGLESWGQQLPVGVFRERVAKSTSHAVSPRGSAAVDLWGISEDTLQIFELKKFPGKSRAQPLGILSELFFYTMLMRAVQQKALAFSRDRAKDGAFRRIAETKRIRAWLLAPQFHPLIAYGDDPVIALLNEGFTAAGEPIMWGRARLTAVGGFEKL